MTSRTLTPLLTAIAVQANKPRPYAYTMDEVFDNIAKNGVAFFMGHTINKVDGFYVAS